MFCECPGRAIPIVEEFDFYAGKKWEIHTWYVGQWSRAHQGMWNLRYTDSSVRRFSAWFPDLCRIFSTTALVIIFLPPPGKTPSCAVLSNFIIIYLIARYDIEPLGSFFRRRTLSQLLLHSYRCWSTDWLAVLFTGNVRIMQCSSDCGTNNFLLLLCLTFVYVASMSYPAAPSSSDFLN